MLTKTELLDDFKAEVTYFRAYQCSCIAANNGVYDPSDNCFYGWRYETPGVSYTLVGKNYRQFSGHFNPGLLTEAQCTFLIFEDDVIYPYIGIGDVLVSDDQTVTRTCTLDITKSNNIPDFDVDTSSTAFVRVYAKDANNDDVIYVRDTHFTYAAQNGIASITWIDSPPEKYYSVKYTAKVNFVVWDVLPAIEGKNETDAYKSVICKLRKFGLAPSDNLIDKLNFASKHAEYVNI